MTTGETHGILRSLARRTARLQATARRAGRLRRLLGRYARRDAPCPARPTLRATRRGAAHDRNLRRDLQRLRRPTDQGLAPAAAPALRRAPMRRRVYRLWRRARLRDRLAAVGQRGLCPLHYGHARPG